MTCSRTFVSSDTFKKGIVPFQLILESKEENSTQPTDPQRIDYCAVSPALDEAADAVIKSCEMLSELNPTPNTTAYLGDNELGLQAPLHGPWKLFFTTAADASFSKNSTRGDARAKNIVDARKGRITNVIDFLPKEDGKELLLKQLNVVIKAKATSEKRVELNFRYAKAVFTRFLFPPSSGISTSPFITRCVVLFYRIFRRGQAKSPPKAFFDVLYLDNDLRIHKTGENNLFVQARPHWREAQDLLE